MVTNLIYPILTCLGGQILIKAMPKKNLVGYEKKQLDKDILCNSQCYHYCEWLCT
jgi:hypothetical protein